MGNFAEVQLAGDHEDDGTVGRKATEAAGSTLIGLEQAVDGIQEIKLIADYICRK